MSRGSDVVIVGAGIIGASLAFRLSQLGIGVSLVDRVGPAAGATGSSFAYQNASHKAPRDYFELNLAGIRAHRALQDELGKASWSFDTGRLAWVPAHDTSLASIASRATSWGYSPVLLDRMAINELEPNLLLEDDIESGAFFPGESAVEVIGLTSRLVREAIDLGTTTVFGKEVIGLTTITDRVTGIELGGGETIGADLVVNCAGPNADRVAALAGRKLPLSPMAGLIVRIEGAAGAISRVIYGPQVQMRPDSHDNGLLLLHHHPADEALRAGEDPGFWAEELANRARHYLPGYPEINLNRWSIGTRALPADGRTSAGVHPDIPGYAEIVTHSGVTLGPLLGQLFADEIVSGTVDPLLTGFRPERFDSAFVTAGAPNLHES